MIEQNEIAETMRRVNELTPEGFYLYDHLGDTNPENWTADLVGSGYYKAQYQGGTRNEDTGEWTGGSWVETGAPSHESLVEGARNQKEVLMAEATVVINPLQDAVDLDEATDEEIALLKEWRKYRVLLNRVIPDNAPNIDWPPKPRFLNRMAADL